MSSDQGEKKRHTLLQLLSLVLVITINGIEVAVLILTTFFSKVVATLKLLPFISAVFDGINTVYHLYKLSLKPLPFPIKFLIGLASLSAYVLGTVPSLVINVLNLLNVSVMPWLSIACPFLIFASLGIVTVLNGLGLFDAAKEYLTKPWTHSKGNVLRLVSRSVKTTTFVLLTGLVIPFLLATGGLVLTAAVVNPFTAGPVVATLFSLMVAASLVLIAMKITKTIIQHRLQEQQALKAAQKTKTPYEILGITTKNLDAASKKERKAILCKQYQTNENYILTAIQDEQERFRKLKENYQAYALLRNERATKLYQICEDIKAGENGHPLPPPEQLLKINSRWYRFRPFLWCHYQVQKHFAAEEEKRKITLAYEMLIHPKLYYYHATVNKMFEDKKIATHQNSSSKIWLKLGKKELMVVKKNKRFSLACEISRTETRKAATTIQENDEQPRMRRSV